MLLLDAYLTAASFIIALLAFGSAYFIFHHFSYRTVRSLAFFWFMAGAVWFFIGITVLFWLLGNILLARMFAYAVFVCVILEGPLLLYHLVLKIFSKEWAARSAFLLYTLGAGLYIYFLFVEKIPDFYQTDWGVVEFVEPYTAHLIITVLFIFPAALVIVDLLRHLVHYLKNKRLQNFSYFFSSLSLLIYMVGGFMDLPGLTGTMLLITKLIVMVSILVAFLGFYFDPLFQSKRDKFEV